MLWLALKLQKREKLLCNIWNAVIYNYVISPNRHREIEETQTLLMNFTKELILYICFCHEYQTHRVFNEIGYLYQFLK